MKLNLQSSIYSAQDLKAVILDIRSYAKWFSQESIKQRFSKGEPDSPNISQPADELILQWHKDRQVSQKSLDELMSELESYSQSAANITITLAAPAPATLKKEIVDWFRQNVNPNVLVDFKFNSTMLGGMVVKVGSHIFDWSFRRQILESKGKFPEILRNV